MNDEKQSIYFNFTLGIYFNFTLGEGSFTFAF